MASIDLLSPLSRTECVQRLQERVGDAYSTYRSVIGRITETEFWLEQRITYRNSFKTRLRAQLVEEESGTRICCRIGMQPFVVGFMIVWSVIVTGGLISTGFRPPAVFAPLTMLGGGAALVAFGRFAAKDERGYLIEFLCNSLGAREV
jgi:hypothetical protein